MLEIREIENRLTELIACNYKGKEYNTILKVLQKELLTLQNWVKTNNQKVVIVFEGQDTAGKTSAIKHLTKFLDTKKFRVVALDKPTKKECGQWYFQKYIKHLPTNGEIVFFDRSWYNRGGVEKVMDFCTNREYNTFLNQVNTFEALLLESNIYLIKLWFSVNREDQIKRIAERHTNKLKNWKLSPIDKASIKNWSGYIRARNVLFNRASGCPWHVIPPLLKPASRCAAALHILRNVPYE